MPSKRYQLQEAIRRWPEEERPKERLVSGGSNVMTNSELLAVLIGSGAGELNAVDIARALLRRFDDIAGIEAATLNELCEVDGVGESKAAIIKAAMELGRRFTQTSTSSKSDSIERSEDAYKLLKVEMKNRKKEVFKTLLLNSRNRLMKIVRISEGALTGTVVHPREVFNPAIRESANGVILAHNHPSGDPNPSDEDLKLTKRLVDAGQLLGITVLDHLIIGDGDYYSFADNDEI